MTHSPRAALVAAAVICAALFASPASALAFGPLSSFASEGEGAGQIESPGSLAIAPNGNAYVADFANSRISVFSAEGAFLFAFGHEVGPSGADVCTTASGCEAATSSDAAGAMEDPESVALDAAGNNVYVADPDLNRIDAFTSEGAFLFAFGNDVHPGGGDICTAASGCVGGDASLAPGGMDEPTGLGVDAAGKVYVADSENNRIDVFTAEGGFLYAFGEAVNTSDGSNVCTATSGCEEGIGDGSAGSMDGPWDVKVAPSGQLLVSDQNNGRVDVFTPAGEFVRAFGREVNANDDSDVCTAASGCKAGANTSEAGALANATAVAVDAANAVYVADSQLNRISQFGSDGNFVRAFGAGVSSGGEAFEVCTLVTSCLAGAEATGPGALSSVDGVAVDCRGAVYGVSYTTGVARVERFGEPGTPLPPCPLAPVEPVSPVATASTAAVVTVAKPVSNKVRFGKLTLNRKKGTATLVVKTPGPGGLVLKGKGLKKVKRVARKAGEVKLPVALAGKAKKKLNKAGKAKVKAKLTFSPTGGTPLTTPRSLTLKKTLAG